MKHKCNNKVYYYHKWLCNVQTNKQLEMKRFLTQLFQFIWQCELGQYGDESITS